MLFGCNSIDSDLYGTWEVHSPHYSSTCKIEKVDRKVRGKIITYDDGTSKIDASSGKSQFLFVDLQKKDDLYVDGMTGATKSSDDPLMSIEIRSSDSIEVTTYHNKKPLTELWTRIQ